MCIFRRTYMYFNFAIPWQPWDHMFHVSISVDVNDDGEYRYTPLIMRLCLGMYMHKNCVSCSQNGLYKPDWAKKKKAQNRLFPNLIKAWSFWEH